MNKKPIITVNEEECSFFPHHKGLGFQRRVQKKKITIKLPSFIIACIFRHTAKRNHQFLFAEQKSYLSLLLNGSRADALNGLFERYRLDVFIETSVSRFER